MIDLSWSHILIVLVVALVVVGPKDLPRLMRIVGRWMAKARAMADQFRKSFDEMARQAELDELRAEIDALRRERPLASIENALNEPALPPDEPAKPGVDAPQLETEHEEPEPHDAAPAQPIFPNPAEPPPP
jgi:sec-independent protein translocase protein TatB